MVVHHQSHIWQNSGYGPKWFWFSSYGPKCCQPIKLQDSLKYSISRKKGIMKFVFGMQINIEVFYKLVLSFWVCIARLARSIQNKKLQYLCNIFIKTWAMELLFCLQINTKVFFKLIVSLYVCKARHGQNTQNSKFAISFQYLKEHVKDKADFLPADKH